MGPDRITPATTNAVFIIDALTALGRNGLISVREDGRSRSGY